MLFIIPFLFYLSGYGQALSLKDLVNIANGHNIRTTLSSKSFRTSDQGARLQVYFLNRGTKKEQQVIYEAITGKVVYILINPDYLYSLLKQAQNQYPIVHKDDQGNDMFYQFGDTDIKIDVTIDKTKGIGSISVSKEDATIKPKKNPVITKQPAPPRPAVRFKKNIRRQLF